MPHYRAVKVCINRPNQNVCVPQQFVKPYEKTIQVSALSLILAFTRITPFAWMLVGFPALSSAENVRLYFDPDTPQIAFAANDINAALEKRNHTVQSHPLAAQAGKPVADLGTQAYALRTITDPDLSYWVLGGDAVGVIYGGLQIAENISVSGFSGSFESEESPYLLNRGMKLNLPLDRRIPTYVGGWSSNLAKKAIPHVWDMTFWAISAGQ